MTILLLLVGLICPKKWVNHLKTSLEKQKKQTSFVLPQQNIGIDQLGRSKSNMFSLVCRGRWSGEFYLYPALVEFKVFKSLKCPEFHVVFKFFLQLSESIEVNLLIRHCLEDPPLPFLANNSLTVVNIQRFQASPKIFQVTHAWVTEKRPDLGGIISSKHMKKILVKLA